MSCFPEIEMSVQIKKLTPVSYRMNRPMRIVTVNYLKVAYRLFYLTPNGEEIRGLDVPLTSENTCDSCKRVLTKTPIGLFVKRYLCSICAQLELYDQGGGL